MKKLVLVALLVCSQAMAQAPNVASIGAQLVQYLLDNGAVGTGYGTEWGMKEENRGVTVNYSIETGLPIHVWKLKSDLALGYSTTFSDVNRQHLFLAVPVHYFKNPPWISQVLNTPKVTVASGPSPTQTLAGLFPNFESFKIQPAIGLRPEDIWDLRLNYKRLFLGVQYQFSFN